MSATLLPATRKMRHFRLPRRLLLNASHFNPVHPVARGKYRRRHMYRHYLLNGCHFHDLLLVFRCIQRTSQSLPVCFHVRPEGLDMHRCSIKPRQSLFYSYSSGQKSVRRPRKLWFCCRIRSLLHAGANLACTPVCGKLLNARLLHISHAPTSLHLLNLDCSVTCRSICQLKLRSLTGYA